MNDETKPVKVIFAPGALDDFEGTQEELDAFIKEIQEMAASGELEQNAKPVDLDDYSDDPELQEELSEVIETLIKSDNRTLH